MTLRNQNKIIRVGDIVTPIRENAGIKRIGYPLVFTELRDEAKKSPEADAVAKLLFGNSFASGLSLRADPDKIPMYIVDAVAKSFVQRRAFGGNQRTIHYHPPESENRKNRIWTGYSHPVPGQQYRVINKTFAKTGIRFPAWGDGDDYEDGGLNDMKTHIILHFREQIQIEVTDVKLVMRAQECQD